MWALTISHYSFSPISLSLCLTYYFTASLSRSGRPTLVLISERCGASERFRPPGVPVAFDIVPCRWGVRAAAPRRFERRAAPAGRSDRTDVA